MIKEYSVGGYVKLAKLWERNRDNAIAYHQEYYKQKCINDDVCDLFDVYVDITGSKDICKRPEMLRLMRDCAEGKVNLIAAQTRAYLAGNIRELCYWLNFIFNLRERVDIITEDEDFNIDTILNEDNQREALEKMAEDFIYLNPPDQKKWLEEIVTAIANLND